MVQEVARKCKKVTTNGNGLGIEVVPKNSKVQSGEINIVVHVNKMARF
jgi:hypothetical protein